MSVEEFTLRLAFVTFVAFLGLLYLVAFTVTLKASVYLFGGIIPNGWPSWFHFILALALPAVRRCEDAQSRMGPRRRAGRRRVAATDGTPTGASLLSVVRRRASTVGLRGP